MLKFKINTTIYVLFLVLILSCSKEKVSITLVNTNFKQQKTFILDYTNAFREGFVIPSKQADGISSLKFSFQVKNFNQDTLYYKLYYQNESYKFGNSDTLNSENFYGCSAATLAGFNKIGKTKNKTFMINDSIIIKGNPRNEKRYYGSNTHRYGIDTNNLAAAKHTIKSDTVWYKKIIDKAKNSHITIKKQLELDALWVVNHDKGKNENNKWERNPRVGKYSVLLVITDKQGVAKIPKYILNTTLKFKGRFINPYAYFSRNKSYFSLLVKPIIAIKAEVPIKNGIYITHLKYTDTSYFNKYIGDGKTMFDKAAFTLQETALLPKEIANIPVKAKFLSKNYTKQDYVNNIKKYKGKRIKTRFTNTTSPGKTLGIDAATNTLWFKNPYYKNEYKKENIGVKTRHGFTYGKYTFKIKMANLLTKDNVWTGLTNALWLIKESGDKWNTRRICKGEGFMPYYGAGKGAKRVPQISYSEIDFEILKTAETWPSTSYPDQLPREDPPENDDKVMVTCTNWDMACTQPKNFGVGIQKINYKGLEFYPHRWDYYYNALTAKSPQKDSELFNGAYFYFQIEWKPKEIIWRIGASKNNLSVVCYMNDKITTIPNNQMLAVITQEYHFAEWWPKSPYKQQNIPFIGEDLKGRLYSLEIE